MSKQKKIPVDTLPDFRALVSQITFKEVLGHYGLLDSMMISGDQLRSPCPIHQGGNKSSFSVNTQKNIYKCFSCGSQGNILDFVVAMESCSKFQAGRLLENWFTVGSSSFVSSPGTMEKNKRVQEKNSISAGNDGAVDNVEGNKPLTFTLKNLDTKHSYLLDRVKPETVKHFDLGVCSKGLMAERLVVPIHNEKVQLIAYVGRSVSEIVKEKYKFPPSFKKGLVLFNLYQVKKDIKNHEPLILVEGFFDVFRLYELGYMNVVALMGCFLTAEQEKLLKTYLSPSSKLILMFDKDEPGFKCRDDVLKRLSGHCFVKAITLPEGIDQPDQLKQKIVLF